MFSPLSSAPSLSRKRPASPPPPSEEPAPRRAREEEPELRLIDDAELGRHRVEGDCWVAFEGRVYDASRFRHPGGVAMLTEPDDRDITRAFRAVHSAGAGRLLQALPVVGRYSGRAEEAERRPAVFDARTGRLSATFASERHQPVPAETAALHEAFRSYVLSDGFPCLGAKLAFSRGTYAFAEYPAALGSKENAFLLARDLTRWAETQPSLWAEGQHYTTFVAVFPKEAQAMGDEAKFETRLIQQLQSLHDHDRAPWPEYAITDVADRHFKLAFAGRTYFPVGLFPKSSRVSRTFDHPVVVFNADRQFAHLEETGQFKPLQSGIRRRDKRISGAINPNIEFGYKGSGLSEASGRDHSRDEKPFRPALSIETRPEKRPGWLKFPSLGLH